ncbi:MAG: site-specific DNA-methyltransferase, partial [Lachnospiraceae bacterium]|nr:site-specific DNA-methyltransferase [Lachnospiraceae bacterium]
IKHFLKSFTSEDSLILDFFSGSATTAHAVMQLNAEDGGKRKFIMVQLPEETNEKSEAYKNICEIGEERIRRAEKKIKEESGADIDYGFRVFRVDSSNMKVVYYCPAEYTQEQLSLYADNIKPDRRPEDLLFQVMLDLGVLLSSKIDEEEIAGKKVFSVENGYLIACFDNNVTGETVRNC